MTFVSIIKQLFNGHDPNAELAARVEEKQRRLEWLESRHDEAVRRVQADIDRDKWRNR